MAKAAPARVAAAALAGEVRRRDARAREVLRGSQLMDSLDERDRALASRLVLGLVGAGGYVRQVVGSHLTGKVEPKVMDALCVSAFELLFLDTPSAIAVSQGVELVRRVRPRAAGLANAVLRKVAGEDVAARREALARVEALPADAGNRGEAAGGRVARGKRGKYDDEAFISALALASGYPAWIVERVAVERGWGAARDLALSALGPAPVYVCANLFLHGVNEAFELLESAGLGPVATGELASFELTRPAGLARSGLVDNVDVAVADLSAQRVVGRLGIERGQRVLEVGQGRGTKSLLLQNLALTRGGAAQVVGVELEPFKVEVARRRMERAGLGEQVSCVAFDGRDLAGANVPEVLAQEFDLAFVDAPCSGTGTLRRHPEIAWSLRAEALDASSEGSLPWLQLRLLVSAASRVRVGGRLAYATCSIVRAENEDVVEAFLASEAGAAFELEGKPFQSLPAPGGADGHFAALFSRKGQ